MCLEALQGMIPINEHPFPVLGTQQGSQHTTTGNAELAKFEQATSCNAISNHREIYCIVLDHASPLSSSHSALSFLLLHAGSI